MEPYGWVDSDGTKHGIVYKMHQAIGERTGMRFTNEILPFARMIEMLKNGQLDLITCQTHDSALQAGEKLAVENKINVIAATNKNTNIHSVDGLYKKNVICIISTSYKRLRKRYPILHQTLNYKSMLQMLKLHKELDAGIFSEPAYYYWVKELNYSLSDFGDVIHLETRDDWAFVRKGLPEQVKEKIRQAIASLQQEKYYEHLLETLQLTSLTKQ